MPSIKDVFKWALPLTEKEKKEIWENAVLTVDTNVLLDLYRYHKDTRESILNSLKLFKGRIWLSDQAANEFFKNKNEIIYSAKEQFEAAQTSTIQNIKNKIDNIASDIKGNRAISKKLIDALELDKYKTDILEKLDKVEWDDAYINNTESDNVLENILELFGDNNCLGEPFSESDKKELIELANKRFENKIPPGYADAGKDGKDRKYGDFFLWEQILRHGNEIKKPIILVTSEQKEDWWERRSGKTIGLRLELKKEAQDRECKILVLQTKSFLALAEKYKTDDQDIDNKDAIDEVKQLDKEKINQETHKQNKSLLHSKIHTVKDVQQEIEYIDDNSNVGYLICTISRPTSRFTVTGRFNPRFKIVPKVSVRLIDSPSGVYSDPHAATGTTYDFNIHLHAERGNALPEGEYVFKYFAFNDSINYFDSYEKIVNCPECFSPYLVDANVCTECDYHALRECQACGAEILPQELDCAPFCGHCAYMIEKLNEE